MKIAVFLCSAAVLFCLAGCLPISQNPLSDPEKAVTDARLAGVWYGKSGEDTMFLHFVASGTARMDVVEVDHEQKGGAHTTIYTMFPSEIDGVRYMNVQEKKGTNKSYYLARYQITSTGSLAIWLMSEKQVAKAIKSEKITGQVEDKPSTDGGEPNRDVTITATTERLAAFVGKSDPDILFSEKFGTFKKLTLPALDPSPEPTPKKEGDSAKPHKKKKPTQ